MSLNMLKWDGVGRESCGWRGKMVVEMQVRGRIEMNWVPKFMVCDIVYVTMHFC